MSTYTAGDFRTFQINIIKEIERFDFIKHNNSVIGLRFCNKKKFQCRIETENILQNFELFVWYFVQNFRIAKQQSSRW